MTEFTIVMSWMKVTAVDGNVRYILEIVWMQTIRYRSDIIEPESVKMSLLEFGFCYSRICTCITQMQT